MMIENLVETTSARQAKNGTRQFHDEITGHSYATYKSGYVRRIISFHCWMTNDMRQDMYQLNKKCKNSNERILVQCENERMRMLIHYANVARSKKK